MIRKKNNNLIKVLHPITRLIVGGAQENTMYTAAMVDNTRFDVCIVSGSQTGSEGSLIDEVHTKEIPLTIIPELVREINPLKDGAALWKMIKMMKDERYLIVHTHSSKAGVLGRIAAKIAGVPIIIHTIHGWSFHEHMQLWRKWLFVCLEKMVTKFSDCLIVVAEVDIYKGLKEGIGEPETYQLIRSAIPISIFNPDLFDSNLVRRQLGFPVDVPILGNVGRFSPQKNPLDWVKVASTVSRVIPDCHFLLVGDGPLRHEVEIVFEKLGLLNHCVFTGLRRDVPQMMAAMDIFLLTSLWEGLPRVIPQCMAMGLPIVAYRTDGAVEAINHGQTGFLCEPGEIDEMAKFCITLLQDYNLRKEMGENAREVVADTYDLSKMIRQIESLYNQLLIEKGIIDLGEKHPF